MAASSRARQVFLFFEPGGKDASRSARPGSMVMLMWLSLFPSWLLLGVVEAELEPPPLLDPPEPPPPQLPPPEKKPLMPDCNHTPESPWLLKFSCVAAAENVWSEQTQTQHQPVTWHDQLHVAKQWKSALDNCLEILPCGELAGVLVGEKLAGCQQGNGEGVQVPSSVWSGSSSC